MPFVAGVSRATKNCQLFCEYRERREGEREREREKEGKRNVLQICTKKRFGRVDACLDGREGAIDPDRPTNAGSLFKPKF